jgi:anti-anti-sigma regulatory factor
MSDSCTIVIPERFDFSQHKTFTEQSNQLIQDEQVKTVILDFSRTSYLDSSALGMLVLLKKPN